MKKVFILLCVLAVGMTYLCSRTDKNTIIVYASAEQFRNDELQKQLNDVFPGLSVRVMYMPTAKAAAKLKVEGGATDADIVLGLEIGYSKQLQYLFADISKYNRIEYLEGLNPSDYENKFVIWERNAGSFVVNTEIIERYGLSIPETYEDLLKPEYQGMIAMPDPKSSSTGYFYLKNLVNTQGEESAFAYFDKLSLNIKQFSESGSGPIKLLKQGEVAIALGMTFQAVNEIEKGAPFTLVYPPEGSPYTLATTALVLGGETNPDIIAVFDYIINDFNLYDKAHFSPELTFVGQEILLKSYPKNIRYADMNGFQDIDEKIRLLEKWDY